MTLARSDNVRNQCQKRAANPSTSCKDLTAGVLKSVGLVGEVFSYLKDNNININRCNFVNSNYHQLT